MTDQEFKESLERKIALLRDHLGRANISVKSALAFSPDVQLRCFLQTMESNLAEWIPELDKSALRLHQESVQESLRT